MANTTCVHLLDYGARSEERERDVMRKSAGGISVSIYLKRGAAQALVRESSREVRHDGHGRVINLETV